MYSDRSVDKKQFSRSADVTLAWLVEPPSTLPETYRVLEDPTHWEVFDAVLTFDQSLLAHKGKFYYFPSFGSYVPEQKWGVFSAKTQLVGA